VVQENALECVAGIAGGSQKVYQDSEKYCQSFEEVDRCMHVQVLDEVE